MTNDDRFDAALRAHVFHRQFLRSEATSSDPAPHPADETPAEPTQPNVASRLEASLVRDLNALAAGLRPVPKKLLPDRTPKSAPESPPAAVEAKPASPYAPASKLPPAAWPVPAASPPRSELPQATERPLSPYAPQAQRPLPTPASGTAPERTGQSTNVCADADPVKTASRYAPPRRPGYPVPPRQPVQAPPVAPSSPAEVKAARVAPANGISPEPDEDKPATSVLVDAAPMIGRAHPGLLVADEGAEEPSDSPSAEELAKLYAPAPLVTAVPARPSDLPEAGPVKRASPYAPNRVRRRITAPPGNTDPRASDFAPRARPTAAVGGDRGKVRPIPWQASDEAPSRASLPSPRGWTGKAAIALVLIALIGGAGAVVTLESLSAPEPEPGTVTADRTPAKGAGDNAAVAGKSVPTRNLTLAASVPASNVEVIHADDGGNGLAPADGSPLPGSAKVIPLPQPVRSANDPRLRPTRDAANGGDIGLPVRTDSKVAAVAPPADDGAPVSGGDPTMDASQAPADGGDNPAAAPRMPTPRPSHDKAPPDGVLAYAPAAEPIDRGATAFARKGDDKPTAKAGPALSAGSARVTAWVNMRVSTDNKAATVKVLSAGSIVTIVQCKYWCEIIADGKRGFVYRSFLKASGDSASAQ